MNKWKAVCLVNGVHTEPIAYATGGGEARKVVESMYAGQKLVIMYIIKIN